jgi:hypothetical protein
MSIGSPLLTHRILEQCQDQTAMDQVLDGKFSWWSLIMHLPPTHKSHIDKPFLMEVCMHRWQALDMRAYSSGKLYFTYWHLLTPFDTFWHFLTLFDTFHYFLALGTLPSAKKQWQVSISKIEFSWCLKCARVWERKFKNVYSQPGCHSVGELAVVWWRHLFYISHLLFRVHHTLEKSGFSRLKDGCVWQWVLSLYKECTQVWVLPVPRLIRSASRFKRCLCLQDVSLRLLSFLPLGSAQEAKFARQPGDEATL